MSPLWALPLLALAGGLAAVSVVARHAVDAAAGLRADVVDLRRLGGEASALCAEAAGLRQCLDDPRRGAGATRRADAAGAPSDAATGALGTRIDR